MASTSRLPPTAWDAARRTTRNLESQLDAKLTQYSSLASAIARGEDGSSTSSSAWPSPHPEALLEQGDAAGKTPSAKSSALESEITTLLHSLSTSLSTLSHFLDDPDVPPTPVQHHAVQRHREVLLDFERDFRRCRDNVRHALDRQELVGKVRGDIDAYRAQQASSDQDALLAERGRLDNSHSMIDGTLEQAYATLTDFRGQRQMLNNVANRMTNTAAQVPALNGIMTMIGRRRRRDSIVMGCLIGCCTVLLLMYITR